MKRAAKIIMLTFALLLSGVNVNAINIVKRGKAASIVVIPANANRYQVLAAEDFIERVEISTGAKLQLFRSDDQLPSIKKFDRIVVGEVYPASQPLMAEEYRVVGDGAHTLYVCGKEIIGKHEPHISRVTMWAFSHIMEEYMGVKWLWPGELGTVTPKMKSISLPKAVDYRNQPELVRRNYDMFHSRDDLIMAWCARNQMAGSRVNYLFQHSFRAKTSNGDWWSEFKDSRPDLLAKSPDGKPKEHFRKDFYKICVSNPDAAEEVLKRWRKAGRPDYWDVTPNDGNGFCTCDACRALDLKYNGKEYTKEQVWLRKDDSVSLSGRYVWFWNKLITAMRKENPNVNIGIFIYSAYRYPAKNLSLEPGVIGEMVDGFEFQNWQDWTDAGIEGIALRANWLWMGACGPHMPMHTIGSYIERARENNMKHIAMDAMHEYWATQGPLYYLIARLISKPEMSTDDVIEEYCDTFEGASDIIKEYIEYWERYHDDVVKYNIPAGGSLAQGKGGLYTEVCREHYKEVLHPLKGHYMTLPYIYTDKMKAEAREILARAAKAEDDPTISKRIEYMVDGINMLDLMCEYVLADKSAKNEKLGEIHQRIVDYNEKYGYWGGNEINMLQWLKIADPSIRFDDM